jgi:hypothetical protein
VPHVVGPRRLRDLNAAAEPYVQRVGGSSNGLAVSASGVFSAPACTADPGRAVACYRRRRAGQLSHQQPNLFGALLLGHELLAVRRSASASSIGPGEADRSRAAGIGDLGCVLGSVR